MNTDNTKKILLLADLKRPVENILNSTVNLAKMIQAKVELFYVKKHTEIVKQESQLSAIRAISQSNIKIDKELLNLIEPISKVHDIKIKHSYAFGSVKKEIRHYIENQQPDIVVLGKRNKTFSPFGNNITNYILNHFGGTIIILNNDREIITQNTLNFGVFNPVDMFWEHEVVRNLLPYAKMPLKSYSIETDFIKSNNDAYPMIKHIFDQGNQAIPSLSNYLSKSNVDLLYINRNLKQNNKTLKTDIKDIIGKLDVNILLSAQWHQTNTIRKKREYSVVIQ